MKFFFSKSQLGNISKTNKYWRLLREITLHMSLHTSGDKQVVRQAYMPVLLPRLVAPLKNSPVTSFSFLCFRCLKPQIHNQMNGTGSGGGGDSVAR